MLDVVFLLCQEQVKQKWLRYDTFFLSNSVYVLMDNTLLQKILVDKEDLPAGKVKPINGNLYWIVDEAAGALL